MKFRLISLFILYSISCSAWPSVIGYREADGEKPEATQRSWNQGYQTASKVNERPQSGYQYRSAVNFPQPENANRFSSTAPSTVSTSFDKMVQIGHRFNLSAAEALAILLINSLYGNANLLKMNSLPPPAAVSFSHQSSLSTRPSSNQFHKIKSLQKPEPSLIGVISPQVECGTANKQDNFAYEGQFGSQFPKTIQESMELNAFKPFEPHSSLINGQSPQQIDQNGNLLIFDGSEKGGSQSTQITGQLAPPKDKVNQRFVGYTGSFEDQAKVFRDQRTQLLNLNEESGKWNQQLSHSGSQLMQRLPDGQSEFSIKQMMLHSGLFNAVLRQPSADETTQNAKISTLSISAAQLKSPSSSAATVAAVNTASRTSPAVPSYAADQKGLSYYKFVHSRPKALPLINSKQQQQQQQIYYSKPLAAALDYLQMHLKSLDFEAASDSNCGDAASAVDAQQVFGQPSLSSSSQLRLSDSASFQPSAEIYSASVQRPNRLYGVPLGTSGGGDIQ